MRIVFHFFVLVIAFACRKNVHPPMVPITQNISTDSTFLDQIIQSDTSGTFSQQIISRFGYDNFKRVVSIRDSNSTTNTFTFPLFQNRTDLFYFGPDSLPFKSIMVSQQPASGNFDTTQIFYFYNAAGKKIKDSTIHSRKFGPSASPAYTDKSTIVSNYSYVPNKITGQIFKSYSSSLQPAIIQTIFLDTAFLDPMGNVYRNLFYHALKVKRTSFLYDNQPNPYRQIAQLAPTLPQEEYGSEFLDGGFWAKNNIIYIGVDSYNYTTYPNNITGYNIQFIRQYFLNGFPKISKEGYQITKRFFYKTL